MECMGRSVLFSLSVIAGCAVPQGPPSPELGGPLHEGAATPPRAQRPSAPQFSGAAGVDDPASGVLGAATERPPDTIYRDELWRATNDGSAPYLLRALQPEVYRPNGRFIGWQITSTWPGDPSLCAAACDLVEGDIILTVNGRPVERPEQLSALIEAIPTMERLDVQMIRDGNLRKRSFAVVDRAPSPR